jgi:formate dehydrogenase iron-sulfur subunit
MACPFGVPKYQWDRALPVVGKCILCAGRVAAGKPTACAEACLVKATIFGERDALIAEARARIAAKPYVYVDHIYGLHEAGGTSVLMISKVPFDQLGMKTNLPRQPLPLLTWQVLSKVPEFVVLAGTFLLGLHWITHRRALVRAAEPPPRQVASGAGGWRTVWQRIFGSRRHA